MSMLAEKKRREKWSLNPRGKAWSEDQNKFGQRLMEKMGWKAGLGLGVNSQGPTDIVKARVKNDNKGLGFKENGEEWLKTTSDFDNLLDELSGSHEEVSNGRLSNTPTSLEDRSKKSRARVHYHKFTRGKDLSRYSEKDLASIIGHDVVKNKQESNSDYTQNQVNKGSLEEYFRDKSKSKYNNTANNTNSGSGVVEETTMYSKDESKDLDEKIANSEVDPESTLVQESRDGASIKKKKKRKKNNSDESVSQDNLNIEDSGNCQVKADLHSSETEVLSKKKKKKKRECDFANDKYNLEEKEQNEFNSAIHSSKKDKKSRPDVEEHENPTESLISCESHDNISKKKKRKHEHSPQAESISCLENAMSQTESNAEYKMKKKRRKLEGEEVKQIKYSDDFGDTNNIDDDEAVADSDFVSKKKKTSKHNNKEHEDALQIQIECGDAQTNNNPSMAEEATVDEVVTKKKKKTKNKSKECQENPLNKQKCTNEMSPECEQVDLSNKPGGFLKVLGRRTRLKNVRIPLKTSTNDSYQTEEFMSFGKSGGSEKEASTNENLLTQNIDDDVHKQCVIYSESNPFDCNITKDCVRYENSLVINKLSKFKRIKKPHIVITDSEKLLKTTVKKLKELHRVRYYKSFLPEKDVFEIDAAVKTFCEGHKNAEVSRSKDAIQSSEVAKPKKIKNKVSKNNEVVEKLDESPKIQIGKYINNNCKIATSKDIENKAANEKADGFKCYGEINPDDCNMPKHVVAYEYRLVTGRLKQLEISPPDVKVVIKEANTLSETTRRKLKQINKIRHLKTLLPPDDVTEIDAFVTKFHDNLKPKIEMMTIVTDLEENILEIAASLDNNVVVKGKEKDSTSVTSLLPDKVEGLTKLLQKLETFLANLRKTKDEPSTSSSNIKKSSDAEDEEYKIEPRCVWLKRVEEKLDIFKESMKMLAEGKIPPGLKTSKESRSLVENTKKRAQKYDSRVDKNHYQNTSYLRGRIAHNVGNQRSRGRGIGRGQPGVRLAVPSGGWGVLKSYGLQTEPGLNSENKNVRGGFSSVGGFMGRGRLGFGDGGFTGRGKGFGGELGVLVRGRGGFRGRGRGDLRGRGRISQNNYDAKLYAEKCKDLNKIPDVCFNGVNMKVISGYPANVSLDQINASSKIDSKCLTNTPNTRVVFEGDAKKEGVALDLPKKYPSGFSEVVIRKDSESVKSAPSPRKHSEKGTSEKETLSKKSTIKKGNNEANET